MSSEDPRRELPAIGRLLEEPALRGLVELYGRGAVAIQARRAVEAARGRLATNGAAAAPSTAELAGRAAARLEAELGRRLRRVVNATGVLVHTNLGRSPLPRAVADELPELLAGYCDLELDLADGRRGERNRRAARLVAALTGAEDALVANNNAAALTLALATLAAGREVVVSRGELVEIGGSFRIPDLVAAAGARLREVGTTNRTRLADYAAALGDATGLLLKVHPSNYRIRGFVATVPAAELAGLARERGLPLLVDEGAGLLAPATRPQLADHPSFRTLLAAGADLVAGSGDKLLGGPQAGILAGRAELVARCRRHPLYRALRPGRETYAALEAVLRRHLAGEPPPLERLWPDPAVHRRRVESVAAAVGGAVAPADAYVGGGAAPDAPIPGDAVALPADAGLLARLRRGGRDADGTLPPVVAYARDDRLWLDLRTVDPEDDPIVVRAVLAARAAAD